MGVATTALLLAMSAASGLSLRTQITVGLLLLAACAGLGFVARQRRAATPLIDLALFPGRRSSWGCWGPCADTSSCSARWSLSLSC